MNKILKTSLSVAAAAIVCAGAAALAGCSKDDSGASENCVNKCFLLKGVCYEYDGMLHKGDVYTYNDSNFYELNFDCRYGENPVVQNESIEFLRVTDQKVKDHDHKCEDCFNELDR